MDRTELRKRWIMGTIQPELFYIPWKEKVPVENCIYITAYDENNNPVKAITQISLSYFTYQLYHNLYKDEETGQWIVDRDAYSKGYAFETNHDWRYVVPNPSQWEIYPVPDLRNCNIESKEAIVTAYTSSVTVVPNTKTNIVAIYNLPIGNYTITVNYDTNNYSNLQYYPTYYNNERYEISHNSGYVQIDRNGKFSGFYMQTINDPDDGHPTGYDFYGITTKFVNNNMPVSLKYIPNIKYVICWVDIDNVTGETLYQQNSNLSIYNYINPISHTSYNIGHNNTCSNVTYGKVLAIKLYVENEYKGMVVKFPDLHQYSGSEYLLEWVGITDIHDPGYTLSSSRYFNFWHWGLMNIGTNFNLPDLSQPLFKSSNVYADFTGSVGHYITLSEAQNAGYSFDEPDYYKKELRDDISGYTTVTFYYEGDFDTREHYVKNVSQSYNSSITSVQKNGNRIIINQSKTTSNTAEVYDAIYEGFFYDGVGQDIEFGDLKSYSQFYTEPINASINVVSLAQELILAQSGTNPIYKIWNGNYPEFDTSVGTKAYHFYDIKDITANEFQYYSQFMSSNKTVVEFEEA